MTAFTPPWLSLSSILLLSTAALMIWPIFGAAAAAGLFAAGILLLLVYHLFYLLWLLKWLEQPRLEKLPQGIGSWGNVFNAMYHRERQLARSQQRLELTLNRFQHASEALPDGVIVLDERERIEWFNPAAQRHLGLRPEHDMGQQLSYLVRHPQFIDYLAEETPGHPLIFRPLVNQDLILSVQTIPIDTTRKMLLMRDITQLERANIMRRDFVANVSHELRTPLTVIGGFLETMIDMPEAQSELFQRYFPLMLDQTGRMQRLISDLLTLSRLENGGSVSEEPVNTPRLINVLKTEAEGLSQGRHTILVESGSPLWLRGNEDELHSAFGNLVSNAIRYTPAGGTITLSWAEHKQGAAFAVIDTGIGIGAEHIPRLTERFYRVDKGRSRETGGTGLGLAIVKHSLMRHQGWLEITSEAGHGSCFACCFPASRLIPAADMH